MNSVFIICALCLLPFFSGSEHKEICWTKEIKLSWDDFLGEIPSDDTDFEAVTWSTIVVRPVGTMYSPNYTVFAKFSRKKSWSNNNLTKELLQHEQLHFDMTELYARKVRKSIDSLKSADISEKEIYLNKIKYWIKVAGQEQSKYDDETFHGGYNQAQKAWNEKIYLELEKYDDYYVEYDSSILN